MLLYPPSTQEIKTEQQLLTKAVNQEIQKLPENPIVKETYIISFIKDNQNAYIRYNNKKYKLYFLPTRANTTKEEKIDYEFEKYILINIGFNSRGKSSAVNQSFLKITPDRNDITVSLFSYTKKCRSTTDFFFGVNSSTDVFSDINNFYSVLNSRIRS